jgi:hypothetical protein
MQVRALLNLLASLGIKRNRVYPSYNSGGNVAEITKGKYNFKFQIPEDKLAKQVFLEEGIPKENLIKDKSRNTLLALKLEIQLPDGSKKKIPSPWAYRNEISINLGTKKKPKLIDIGTIERFVWKPVYKDEEIIDLEDIEDEVSIAGVGLERLCMVVNKLKKIQDIDYLRPFYDALKIKEKKYLVGESLRALHRIFADIKKYKLDLSKSRKEKVNKMIRIVLGSGLEENEIRKLLKSNAKNQPWHPELADAVEDTLVEIKEYINRRAA